MTIKDILLDYNQALTEMLSHIFGMKYRDSKTIQYGLCPFSKDNIVMTHFTGPQLTGELIFAIDKLAAEHLLSTVVSKFDEECLKRHLLHSALEELANVSCYELKKCESFTKTFGDVHFQPPVVWVPYSEDKCIPLKHGTSGEVTNGRHSIATFISFAKAHSVEIEIHDFTESNA